MNRPSEEHVGDHAEEMQAIKDEGGDEMIEDGLKGLDNVINCRDVGAQGVANVFHVGRP